MSEKLTRAIEQISALRTFDAMRRMHSISLGEDEPKPQSRLPAESANRRVLHAPSYHTTVPISFVSTLIPGYAVYSLRKVYATQTRMPKHPLRSLTFQTTIAYTIYTPTRGVWVFLASENEG